MEHLKEAATLAFKMDSDLGQMHSSVTGLKDVEVILGEVVQGLETELERYGHILDRENHLRRLRVLYSLLSYTNKDLNKDFESIHQANNSLIEQLQKENSLAANETALKES
jgi:hypothetical protein